MTTPTRILIGIAAAAIISGGAAYSITPVREAILGKPQQEQINILADEIEKIKQSKLDISSIPSPTIFVPIKISDRKRIEKELGQWVGKFYEKYPCSTTDRDAEIFGAKSCFEYQWSKFESDSEYIKMIEDYNTAKSQGKNF